MTRPSLSSRAPNARGPAAGDGASRAEPAATPGAGRTAELFEAVRAFALNQAGIAIPPTKKTLVRSRVARRVRALGLPDARAYLQYLREEKDREELVRLLNALTTNFTSFFRDPEHFEDLAARLRRAHTQGQRRFRLWSAASSTGEEPFSMAITALEAIGSAGHDLRILATDISTDALSKAKEGRYAEDVVAKVPGALRDRYFRRRADGTFEVRDFLRRLVHFERMNLARWPYVMSGPFDAIFCRNVLMYLAPEVRQGVVRESERLLRPGGVFYTSPSESIIGLSHGLVSLRASIHERRVPAQDTTQGSPA